MTNLHNGSLNRRPIYLFLNHPPKYTHTHIHVIYLYIKEERKNQNMNRKTFGDLKGSIIFYLSHVSEMSFVVLQLFPNLAPHKAGCISPLINETENKVKPKIVN